MNTRNWQVMGESFELESPRYKVMDYLGSGAYGVSLCFKCKLNFKKCLYYYMLSKLIDLGIYN